MSEIKRVRILLRVSSNQQLEADGDLYVQRDIIKDYIAKQENWVLDDKEYFEGSNSGYKNSVSQREILGEIAQDAKNDEFDILVVYKDDRVGRRMWDIGSYVMQLKALGIDIYTVKDGLISPDVDDIMGQMMLALRYGNAQKSSSDTGMRVKDTAKKLTQNGKFMGGKAPYGYELILSGEISKHGRALKKLQIIQDKADIVKHIYDLSLYKEYGSSKIARILNEDDYYKTKAPNDFWKSGTITSILTNPIYAGITAYNRREKKNGAYHRIGSDDWIYAKEVNEEIAIINIDDWNETQRKRKLRVVEKGNAKFYKDDLNIIKENKGSLSLIDVAYCGYCNSKLCNGTKYNYWKIKDTGEKRASKYPIYKCQLQWGGVPHKNSSQYRADVLEEIVFKHIAEYISTLQDDKEIFDKINDNNNKEKETIENKISNVKNELVKINEYIAVMKSHIPDAMLGNYALSVEVIASAIEQYEKDKAIKEKEMKELSCKLSNIDTTANDLNEIYSLIPKWQDVLYNADQQTKRVLVNKIVDKIIITKEKIQIKFKVNLGAYNDKDSEMKCRIGDDFVVSTSSVIRGYTVKSIILNDLVFDNTYQISKSHKRIKNI